MERVLCFCRSYPRFRGRIWRVSSTPERLAELGVHGCSLYELQVTRNRVLLREWLGGGIRSHSCSFKCAEQFSRVLDRKEHFTHFALPRIPISISPSQRGEIARNGRRLRIFDQPVSSLGYKGYVSSKDSVSRIKGNRGGLLESRMRRLSPRSMGARLPLDIFDHMMPFRVEDA